MILDLLGNETRRKILQSIALEPRYTNQLIKELEVNPRAVQRHLKRLEEAGLITTYMEKSSQGPPRKYHTISQNFIIEVMVSPELFNMDILPKKFKSSQKNEIEDIFPELEAFEARLSNIRKEEDEEKRLGLISEIIDDIEEEITYYQSARDYLGKIRIEVRKERRKVIKSYIELKKDEKILLEVSGTLNIDVEETSEISEKNKFSRKKSKYKKLVVEEEK